MARSFRRGSRTHRTTKSNTVSPRALRNKTARKANAGKTVKTSDGKVYKNYKTYKQAIQTKRENENKPEIYPTSISRPDAKYGSSYAYNSRLRNQIGNEEVYNKDKVKIPGATGLTYDYKSIRKRKEEEEKKTGALEKIIKSNEARTKAAIQSGNTLAIERAAKDEAIFNNDQFVGTQAYQDACRKVLDVLQGKYMNGVTSQEYIEWEKRNKFKTGQKDEDGNDIYALKFNAEPPPVGYDANGNTVDISNEWKYYQSVERYRTLATARTENAQKEKESMYANHADQSMDTYNSTADAIIGLATGHGLEGFKKYWSQYILKPLKSGNYSALGLNLLNDLGETLDLIPKGVKAAASAQTAIYGNDTFFTNKDGTSFTNQNVWVYSGGKKKQKALIKAGALDILNTTRYNTNQRAAAIQKIKDAGLWEDYLQFADEYESDYKELDFGTAVKEVKEAYSSHKNYEADTGSLVGDLAVELIMDPTLVLGGGAKSISKSATKKISDEALTTALKGAGKSIDTLDETTAKYLNTQIKSLSEGFLSKGDKEIQSKAYTIGKALQQKGIMTELEAESFRDTLVKSIRQRTDEKAFTVVKSLHYMDRAMDTVDSTLLKSVFAAPYLAMKVPKSILGHVPKKTLKWDVFKKQALGRMGKDIVSSETNTVPIHKADEFLERQKQEHIVSEDPDFVPENYEMIRKDVDLKANQIDRIIIEGADTAEELDAKISSYLQEVYEGKINDFNGYVSFVEELNSKWGGVLDDTLDIIKRQKEAYDNYRKSLSEGLGRVYKEPVVSGKEVELPVVAKDKVVDKSKRLAGGLKKTWRELGKVYGNKIPADSPYELFFSAERKSVPTLAETMQVCQGMLKEYMNNVTLGKITPEDTAMYNQLLDFYNRVVQTGAIVDVEKHLQFNMFQKDKYRVYEEVMSDKYFKQVLDVFTEPTSDMYKFLENFSKADDLDNTDWAVKQVNEMVEQMKSVEAFTTFWRKLHLNNGPLNEDQTYRLLDSVFNREWVDPNTLTDVTGKEMDELINKVNVGLAALDGTESFALDSFRKSAIDFDGDLWSAYADEIKDPVMQDRVRAILAGGHEDPVDDVNVQILQAVLRNPDVIKYYNEQSKTQDVFFYDIETRGTNKDLHEITCIATKKWTLTSDEPTLDELLTMLEKGEGKSYQTYTSEAHLRETISDEILNINYKNRPDIVKSRSAMLDEYCKRFGAESNGKTVTEADMLSEFMKDMDSSFISNSSQAPKLVSHNNNNFDLQFMQRRMVKEQNKTFPAHIKDLNELFSKEENTYTMLRNQYPDTVLSAEQEQFIRKAVADYARNMASFSSSMRVFKPGEFVQSVQNFMKMDLSDHGDDWVNAQRSLDEFADIDEVQEQFLQSLNEDKVIFARDPFHITVESLESAQIEEYFGKAGAEAIAEAKVLADEATLAKYNEELQSLYLSKEYGRTVKGSDSTMRMIKDMSPNDKIPRWGYRTVKVDSVSNYFDIVGQSIPQNVLVRMNSFAKSCSIDISKRLKSNAMLLGHLDEFRKVIDYVKSFADDLDIYDDMCFVKYIKAPESVEEAYVVAQRLWDYFKTTTKQNDAMEYVGKDIPIQEIPEDIRGTVLTLNRFGDAFNIESVASDEVCHILSNTDEMYHHQIFKDKRTEKVIYLDDISEDEILQDALINECRQDEFSLETMSSLYESNKTTKAKDRMIISNLRKSREAVQYYLNLTPEAKKLFRKECDEAVSVMMEAQTAQIMKHITKSEKDLISHLLYHNQLLVVPMTGSALHNSQVSDLMKILSEDSKYLCHEVDNNGYLWVGLKKEWQERIQVKNDAAHATEETEMYFFGESTPYHRPEYERIGMPEGAISDETLAKYFVDTEEQVLRLSKGSSAGSLGIAHTMSKQRNLYANAPQGFLNKAMDLEYTCNERFWHNANYDMTLLGGINNRWKVGNQNDSDYLLATRQTLRESAKKAQAERLFVDGIFGAQEHMSIKDVFPEDMLDEDIVEAFRNNDDMVCVALRESGSTESGFRVTALDVTTKAGVAAAKNEKTVVVPYSMYTTLVETVNQGKAYTGFLKLYSKVLHTYKVGYLFSPGTWVRNFIDATMKAVGDTGDPTGLMKNYISSAQLLRKYKNATKKIGQQRGINHNTLADIERMWDTFGFDMTFEQYKFLDEWMQRSESGGESSVLKLVKEHRKGMDGFKQRARKANDGKDLIGSSLSTFETLPEEEARKMFRKADLSTDTYMTEDEFADIFSKRVVADDAKRIEYENIAKAVMEGERTYKYDLASAYQTVSDQMLRPMSAVEEMVRLGEYMTLEQQGFTESQIFKKITDSQFNYDLKSPIARTLELVVPFYSFMHDNMIYWCKSVSENPRMLRYIEKIWGELSWDFSDYEPEEIISNYSLQEAMLSGNIPIGNSGFMFKAKPSFMDAFNISYKPLEQLYNGIFIPLQPYVQDFLRGSDARMLFGEKTFWEDQETFFEIYNGLGTSEHPIQDALETLPVVGTLVNRYFELGPQYRDRLPENAFFKRAAVTLLPDVFGVIKKNNYTEYGSFEFFQNALKEQGKWYDANTGKVVDISEYNEYGLNAKNLSWDEWCEEQFIRFGKLWDANQNELVNIGQYIPGGLNREWDFDKEGEWDEFCALKKKYLGQVWDNNLGKFVQAEDLTQGGLNKDDPSWAEVIYYNARRGRFFNSETGKFVTTDELTFKEQQAVRALLFGEEWDDKAQAWVQVTNPMEGFGQYVEVANTTETASDNLLVRFGIIAEAYAAEPETVRKLATEFKEATPEELQIFMAAMQKIGLGGYSNYGNYSSGTGSSKTPTYRTFSNKNTGISYVQTSAPTGLQPSTPVRYARNNGQGITAGGKTYGRPYEGSDNQSGLRMAASNYPAYDEYYNYSYTYQYKYRNPTSGVADFPQTKLGIQRYMRMRTDALTCKMRLRAEYNIDNINSLTNVSPKNRIQSIKLHWWMR